MADGEPSCAVEAAALEVTKQDRSLTLRALELTECTIVEAQASGLLALSGEDPLCVGSQSLNLLATTLTPGRKLADKNEEAFTSAELACVEVCKEGKSEDLSLELSGKERDRLCISVTDHDASKQTCQW